jgi:hypothetical protein
MLKDTDDGGEFASLTSCRFWTLDVTIEIVVVTATYGFHWSRLRLPFYCNLAVSTVTPTLLSRG